MKHRRNRDCENGLYDPEHELSRGNSSSQRIQLDRDPGVGATPGLSAGAARRGGGGGGECGARAADAFLAREGGGIYKLIRAYGSTDSRAGLLAGVSTSTISRWKQEDPAFCDFLERARAEFELKRILTLLEATKSDGSPDWRAQAWLLKNAQRTGDEPRPGRPRKETAAQTSAAEPTPAAAENSQKIPENQVAASAAEASARETPGFVSANDASPREAATGTNSKRFPKIAGPAHALTAESRPGAQPFDSPAGFVGSI